MLFLIAVVLVGVIDTALRGLAAHLPVNHLIICLLTFIVDTLLALLIKAFLLGFEAAGFLELLVGVKSCQWLIQHYPDFKYFAAGFPERLQKE